MVDLLAIVDEVGPGRVTLACRGALAAGAVNARAVAVLARRAERPDPEPLFGLDDRLAAVEWPEPDLGGYDALLGRQEARMSRDARAQALEALIEAHATELKLPTVRRRFRQLADEALREQQTPVAYLAALLEPEQQERAERRKRRRLPDARFPVLKRLDEFRFDDNPKVPQATIAALAEGGWTQTASRSSSSATRAPARRIWRSRSPRRPATPAGAFASPRWPAWPTSSKRPTAAASSHVSSPATPASNCWSSPSSATSRCPKVPPSWSSKCSQNATSAAR